MNKILKDVADYIMGTKVFGYNGYCPNKFIYPLDLNFTLQNSNFYFKFKDSDGVPYRVYKSVGKQYNPTRIAAYGLAHYNNYISEGPLSSRDIFLKMANWYLSVESGEYSYNFDWEDLKAPWLSCMAQGEAASVLIRAYKITNDRAYLDHALKSLIPLFNSIDNGGVQSLIDNKYIFLEEYPSLKCQHVLNGFLYGLIGIIETRLISGDEELRRLEEKLVSSLINNINKWGDSNWSYYQIDKNCRVNNYCTPAYHNLHIAQLKFINEHYPNNEIQYKIKSWSNGANRIDVRMKALLGKFFYRMTNKAQR